MDDTLRPTIFDPNSSCKKESIEDDIKYPEILVSSKIAVIIPNEDNVDFEYLFYQLYSPIVKNQHEARLKSSGWSFPYIPLSNIKTIIIPVLKSVEEQRNFISQYKSLLLDDFKKTLRIEEQAEEITKEKERAEFKIVSFLAHNLNDKIDSLKTIIKHLKIFIEDRGLSQESLQKQYYEGQPVGLLASAALEKAGNYLTQMNNQITDTRKLVTEEINKKDFELVNLENLFKKQILPQYSINDKKFKINLNCSLKHKINLHKYSFVEAIDNIIRNAAIHGFISPDENNAI